MDHGGGPKSCHDVPVAFKWLRRQALPQCPSMAPGSRGECWAAFQGAWKSVWDESGSQVPCSAGQSKASRFPCRPASRAQHLGLVLSGEAVLRHWPMLMQTPGMRHVRTLARSGFVVQEVSADTGGVIRYGNPVLVPSVSSVVKGEGWERRGCVVRPVSRAVV